jgi:hypothetical protein
VNTTPRFLNRLLLAVVGLLLLAVGAAGLLVLVLPGAAGWWAGTAPQVGTVIEDVRRSTTLEGQADTWLWPVLAAVLVVLIVLLVLWVMMQGRGRAALFWSGESERPAGQAPGSVSISAGAAEQLLRSALLERPDLVGASVSTWYVRGVPGLRVRVHPRRGTPPYAVAADVSRLVEALDAVTGLRVPVLISIAAGGRARFARTERVS